MYKRTKGLVHVSNVYCLILNIVGSLLDDQALKAAGNLHNQSDDQTLHVAGNRFNDQTFHVAGNCFGNQTCGCCWKQLPDLWQLLEDAWRPDFGCCWKSAATTRLWLLLEVSW